MWDAAVLALGLALDSATVAVTRGAVDRTLARGVELALLVGALHGGLAGLGWLAGREVGAPIARWDHWIAFGLLAALGSHMIVESRRPSGAEVPVSHRLYVALAVATSLDAAAAGLTLPLLGAPPAAILVIALVALTLTGIAFALGGRLAARIGGRLELAGGLVLIAVGVKILVEHLTA